MFDHRHSAFLETFRTYQKKRELRLARCGTCHEILAYSQRLCPKHPNSELEWVEASGRASLHAFTEYCIRYSPAHPAPYVVAMIELEEGPRLVSTVYLQGGEDVRTVSQLKADFDDEGRLVFVQTL